ncbi:MAG: hypothetical protein ACLQO7_02455 [Candidatus Bathyarchaeia archaeon]
MVVELALGLRGHYVFNPLYLRIGLNVVLVAVICSVVAYLSAKGYLLTGSLTLLIITMAFVYISIVSVIIGWLSNYSANWGVTLNGLDLLLFSALQLFASYQASFRSVAIGSEHRNIRLALACVAAVFLSGLLSLLTVLKVFPTFFVNGKGVTLTDQIVFSTAVLLFSLGSMLFLRQHLRSKSNVLYWYTLALVLDAIGTFGITLQIRFSDIVVWTGRLGLYVATVYFLIALLSSRKVNNEA